MRSIVQKFKPENNVSAKYRMIFFSPIINDQHESSVTLFRNYGVHQLGFKVYVEDEVTQLRVTVY